VGVEASFLMGTVTDLKLDGIPIQEEEGINRFDINVGLRFYM